MGDAEAAGMRSEWVAVKMPFRMMAHNYYIYSVYSPNAYNILVVVCSDIMIFITLIVIVDLILHDMELGNS